jgi:hypothetical protein
MDPSNARVTTRGMAIGFSVLMSGAVLLTAAGLLRVQGPSQAAVVVAQDNPEYQQATAGIYGRLQLLPRLEKEMVAYADTPERANVYRRKRADARQRIDELVVRARAAATSDAQRKWIKQLSEMTARADARYDQTLSVIARRQVSMPLAVNTD